MYSTYGIFALMICLVFFIHLHNLQSRISHTYEFSSLLYMKVHILYNAFLSAYNDESTNEPGSMSNEDGLFCFKDT